MGSVGVDDQLGVGEILFQVERVDGVEDNVGLAPDDQHWNLDVFQIREPFADWVSPLLKSRELGPLNLVIDGSVAILHTTIPTLQKCPAGGLTLGRRCEA